VNKRSKISEISIISNNHYQPDMEIDRCINNYDPYNVYMTEEQFQKLRRGPFDPIECPQLCGMNIYIGSWAYHREICENTILKCPLIMCDWVGPVTELEEHCRQCPTSIESEIMDANYQ
jgi:hypothetical protein